MVGKKVTVPVSLLKRIIRFAVVLNDRKGVEECLYCDWQAAYFTEEDLSRIKAMSPAEYQEYWRQFQALQQHEKRCVVTRLRTLLELPNPRAVFVPSEESSDDSE